MDAFGSIRCTSFAEVAGSRSGCFHLLSPADGGSNDSFGVHLPGPTLRVLDCVVETVDAREGMLSREELAAFSEVGSKDLPRLWACHLILAGLVYVWPGGILVSVDRDGSQSSGLSDSCHVAGYLDFMRTTRGNSSDFSCLLLCGGRCASDLGRATAEDGQFPMSVHREML